MTSSDTNRAPSAQGPGAPTNGAPSADETPLARLNAVRARIATAAQACGRDPSSVSLLAVSKTFDAATVQALAACGQTDFGENYLQEALAKIEACGRDAPALRWHFIGPIQSNKTRPIAEHFDWVHSIDRERIASRLNEQRPAALPPLQVCLQVDVSGEATKSGCDPQDALALALAVAQMPRLRLRGLMAIPAPSDDPQVQRAQFGKVREVFDRIRAAGVGLDTLSMGMSADLEEAIGQGATVVRVGTALFGARPRNETVKAAG